MSRDIDKIIERVQQCLPEVKVRQHSVKNPRVDDDGLWWFWLAGGDKEIQLESSHGMCPLLVEHDDMKSSSEAETARSVEDAIDKIVSYPTGSHGNAL